MTMLPRKPNEITTLFLDVAGVLLANGWGHQSRALAANSNKRETRQ
jgi:hypothetical protein